MTYPTLTYVIIYSDDGGKHWHLQGTASEDHADVSLEYARLTRLLPMYKYGMKCVDSYLWQAVQEAVRAT